MAFEEKSQFMSSYKLKPLSPEALISCNITPSLHWMLIPLIGVVIMSCCFLSCVVDFKCKIQASA